MRSTKPKDFRSIPSPYRRSRNIKDDAFIHTRERALTIGPLRLSLFHQRISASNVIHWYMARKKPAPTPSVNSRLRHVTSPLSGR